MEITREHAADAPGSDKARLGSSLASPDPGVAFLLRDPAELGNVPPQRGPAGAGIREPLMGPADSGTQVPLMGPADSPTTIRVSPAPAQSIPERLAPLHV